jgi:hypothetical protein
MTNCHKLEKIFAKDTYDKIHVCIYGVVAQAYKSQLLKSPHLESAGLEASPGKQLVTIKVW